MLTSSIAVALALSAGLPAANAAPTAADAAIPDRTLRCTLGRALNIDPAKNQTVADIRYEGAHRFALFLPGGPARQGPPPDPADDPEPVNPQTRILADPDGLARDMQPRFVRVVDLWPRRVEMAGRIEAGSLSRLIVISEIDAAKGTANLFMTKAKDAGSLDLAQVYQGGCIVQAGAARR